MKSLIRILLLLIPLISILPATAEFGWEQIKVVTFLTLNSLAGFLWLFWLGKSKNFKWSRIKLASLVFILVLLVSSIMGIDPMGSLLGKNPYFQGWILYAECFLFMLMVSTVEIPLMHWAYVLAGSSTLVSILAIKEAISLYLLNMTIPNYAGRVVSTFGQPNLYSGFILLTIPFWWYLLLSFWREAQPTDRIFTFGFYRPSASRMTLVGALIVVSAILISQSRASLLILGGLLLILLLSRIKHRISIIGLSVALILAAAVLSFKFGSGLIFQEIVQPRDQQWLIDNSPEKREYIWPIIGEFILQKPLFGHGLENLDLAFSKYEKFHGDRSPVYYGIKNLVIDRSHNYTLDLLFSSGIIGLVVWLGLILILFRQAKSKILLAGLVVYVIWIQFQIQSVVHLIYFWLLVGLIEQKPSIDKGL